MEFVLNTMRNRNKKIRGEFLKGMSAIEREVEDREKENNVNVNNVDEQYYSEHTHKKSRSTVFSTTFGQKSEFMSSCPNSNSQN